MNNEYLLQTALAVWSVILGAFLCAVYDIFRLLRLVRRQNAVLLFVSDLIFCIFSAVCLLILFFNLSYGRIRMYALLLCAVGFFVWRFTVSRITMKLLQRLIVMIKKLLNLIIMRVSVKQKRLARRIYTIYYCRSAVKNCHPKGTLK